jgi:hypothetical protein
VPLCIASEALMGLGHIHLLQNRHTQATECYQQLLGIARAGGHRRGELEALLGLGHVHLMVGDHVPAADWTS